VVIALCLSINLAFFLPDIPMPTVNELLDKPESLALDGHEQMTTDNAGGKWTDYHHD
jgi:hypothetical protein